MAQTSLFSLEIDFLLNIYLAETKMENQLTTLRKLQAVYECSLNSILLCVNYILWPAYTHTHVSWAMHSVVHINPLSSSQRDRYSSFGSYSAKNHLLFLFLSFLYADRYANRTRFTSRNICCVYFSFPFLVILFSPPNSELVTAFDAFIW